MKQLDISWGDKGLPNLPYYLLSIDLGETTGLAAYERSSRDLRCASTEHFQILLPLLVLWKPDVILLERFPRNHTLEYELEIVYRQLASKSFLVSPGSWKPFMQAQEKLTLETKNQHERDAINMLRYYMHTTFGEDII